jgi:predicted metal-dependent HD superfamily phosphohydrolase
MNKDTLKLRWFEVTGDEDYYYKLIERYAEKQRYYHTIEHISYCLKQLDLVKPTLPSDIGESVTLELALWFHDIVYNIGSQSNELDSVEVALRFLYEHKLNCFMPEVYNLIMMTAHDHNSEDLQMQTIADIDLSSLALPWTRFKRSNRQIEREYLTEFTVEEFREGNTKFLQSLLDKEHIYYTDFFRTKYENLARQNIERGLREI